MGCRARDPRDRRLHPLRHGDGRRRRTGRGAPAAVRRAHPGARRADDHVSPALLPPPEAARRRPHVRGGVAVPRRRHRAVPTWTSERRRSTCARTRSPPRPAPRASTTTWPTCSASPGEAAPAAQFPPSRFPTIFTPRSRVDDGCGRYGSRAWRGSRSAASATRPARAREGGQEQPLAAEQLVLDAGHHLHVEGHLRWNIPTWPGFTRSTRRAGGRRSEPRRPARPRPRTSRRASAG